MTSVQDSQGAWSVVKRPSQKSEKPDPSDERVLRAQRRKQFGRFNSSVKLDDKTPVYIHCGTCGDDPLKVDGLVIRDWVELIDEGFKASDNQSKLFNKPGVVVLPEGTVAVDHANYNPNSLVIQGNSLKKAGYLPYNPLTFRDVQRIEQNREEVEKWFIEIGYKPGVSSKPDAVNAANEQPLEEPLVQPEPVQAIQQRPEPEQPAAPLVSDLEELEEDSPEQQPIQEQAQEELSGLDLSDDFLNSLNAKAFLKLIRANKAHKQVFVDYEIKRSKPRSTVLELLESIES